MNTNIYQGSTQRRHCKHGHKKAHTKREARKGNTGEKRQTALTGRGTDRETLHFTNRNQETKTRN